MADFKQFITDLRRAVDRVEVDFVQIINSIFNIGERLDITDSATVKGTSGGYVVGDGTSSRPPIIVGAWIIGPRDDLPDNIVSVEGRPVTINGTDILTI